MINESYDRLDENGKEQIDLIDLALSKITLGEYGICESCGDEIAMRRLEVLPWARLCVECAREYEKRKEKLPETFEVLGPVRLPDEYQDLAGEQIVRLVFDRLHAEPRIRTDDLQISMRRGILYLEGAMTSEAEHELLKHMLTDSMGFPSVIDHLDISERLAGRKRRAPSPPERTEEVEEHLYESEEPAEELWGTGEDEAGYSPAEQPLPPEDREYGAG